MDAKQHDTETIYNTHRLLLRVRIPAHAYLPRGHGAHVDGGVQASSESHRPHRTQDNGPSCNSRAHQRAYCPCNPPGAASTLLVIAIALSHHHVFPHPSLTHSVVLALTTHQHV